MMKSVRATLNKFALSALVAACGLAGPHGSALADTLQSANICKPAGDSNASGLFSGTGGVYTSGTPMMVICPVSRIATDKYLGVRIEGYASPYPTSAFCYLSSYDQNGKLLGQDSLPVNPLAAHSRFYMLLGLPAAQVPGATSSQDVVCFLPPNSGLRFLIVQQP